LTNENIRFTLSTPTTKEYQVLITEPVKKDRAKPVPALVSARLTEAQAKLFHRLGGASWLRAQLDNIAAVRKAK
jgi:hypothetical protein